MLIGLAGKAGSGKTTVANHLNSLYGFRTLAFANALKEALSVMFDVPGYFFYESNLKNKPILPWKMTPREMMQIVGTDLIRNQIDEDFWIKRLSSELNAVPREPDYFTMRYALNTSYNLSWGNIVEASRVENLRNVKEIEGALKVGARFVAQGDICYIVGDHNSVVIEDVRFENEAAFIRARGGVIVHIRRNATATSNDSHASENGIRIHSEDITLENINGGMPGLYQSIATLVEVVASRVPKCTQ